MNKSDILNGSVTVVVAYYNRSAFLARLLRSVAHQTVLPSEVLITDNGSNERSSEMISSLHSEIAAWN